VKPKRHDRVLVGKRGDDEWAFMGREGWNGPEAKLLADRGEKKG